MYSYIKQIFELPGKVKYFFLSEIVIGIGLGIWNLNLNFYLSSRGMLSDEIGLIVSVGSFSTALFAIICGHLSDTVGHRRSMLIGYILKVAAMAGTAVMAPGWILYIFRGLNGLGDCFVMVCIYPYITSLVKGESKNMVYSLLFSITMISPFLGTTISSFLLPYLGTYKNVILLSAIVICIGTIMIMLLSKASINIRITTDKTKLYFPKQTFVKVYLLYELIGYGGYFLAYSMTNLVCRDLLNMSLKMTGMILGAMTLISGIALFIVPVITRRFERAEVNTGILIFLIPAYILMFFIKGNIFIILLIITASLQCMMGGLVDGPLLGKITEREKGGFSGLRLLIINIGTSVGILIAGIFVETVKGLSIIYLFACLLIVIQLFLFLIVIRKHIIDK